MYKIQIQNVLFLLAIGFEFADVEIKNSQSMCGMHIYRQKRNKENTLNMHRIYLWICI